MDRLVPPTAPAASVASSASMRPAALGSLCPCPFTGEAGQFDERVIRALPHHDVRILRRRRDMLVQVHQVEVGPGGLEHGVPALGVQPREEALRIVGDDPWSLRGTRPSHAPDRRRRRSRGRAWPRALAVCSTLIPSTITTPAAVHRPRLARDDVVGHMAVDRAGGRPSRRQLAEEAVEGSVSYVSGKPFFRLRPAASSLRFGCRKPSVATISIARPATPAPDPRRGARQRALAHRHAAGDPHQHVPPGRRPFGHEGQQLCVQVRHRIRRSTAKPRRSSRPLRRSAIVPRSRPEVGRPAC